ncbi:hypothetical protein J2S49_000677 [Arcanobacterium wilhelmae]|uniref:Uncharacterized protein n=1 Tax=Arcanobacterium wilhelmae TaxID=1803177 RepID=A0ABT9NBK1_9ACTO|nr:hypothetical protein [Arcanobacterium wilhelmae]MDP9800601.1 hypothetical protein [Arcanobacterium wilhelmae]WFN90009.1 hypothetical protein P8A24_07390 [Arcanobacterium wilhelmae]
MGLLKDRRRHYINFQYEIPKGYKLSARADGGVNLLSRHGMLKGEIRARWALDATAQKVPTYFKLIGKNTLRQYVDGKQAAFPITVGASWGWWIVTAAKCAVSLAPLLVAGPPALAARFPKLVSFFNKLSKHRAVAKAIEKVGGVKRAVAAAVKNAVHALRSSLPKWVASRLPKPPPLNDKEKVLLAAAWPILVDNFWDLIGIGSCYSLIRGA